MKIHKITNFQMYPVILLLNVNGGKKEVQNQRTHMPIKNFLIKTFLRQNFLKEKNGLPDPKGTAETSFIEGLTNNMVIQEVEKYFPLMDRNQLNLRYKKITRQGTAERAIIEVKMKHRDKWYPLYTKTRGDTEKTFNEGLPKEIKAAVDPFEARKIKDTENQQKDQESEEIKKTIEENRRIADDENEQPSVRDRVREKVREDTERLNQVGREREQLEQERQQIVERLPLRERLKALFKKHVFTLATVVTAVGITIGVIAKILADGAGAAANGIKTVGKKVGDGLKEMGKKIGSILPGLVGAIASFVFRAAGQAITFLGKNAWLLILFVAAFLIEKITKKR